MKAPVKYVAVENAGMVNEQDVGTFGTAWAAQAWIDRTYSTAERDRASDRCLYPEVCIEVDGIRSYDL